MKKYYILIITYLVSVLSSSVANMLGIDVQRFYRVPFLGIRWIDVAILLIVGTYGFNLTRNNSLVKKTAFIITLCLIYLLFETLQLIRSWHATDTGWQISGFLCTLNFFILIDFSTYTKAPDKILLFLKDFALLGALVIIAINSYLVYSFISGNVIFTDLDTRVAIDVAGAKETVSTVVLTPFVYAFSLYFINAESKFWKKAIYITAILSIYLSLIITFHRGNLATVFLLTIIYISFFSKRPAQAFSRIFGLALFICIGYLSFGGILRQKGYDPVDKISEIVNFTMDVDNPDWDKGRAIPKEYALAAWHKNIGFGVGYNDLYHYGLPEGMGAVHNFVIASLFYRGIIGTMLYLLILIILFGNSIKFWHLLKREENPENDIFKLLIIVSFCWLIPFWTQDVMWEKYSLSIQFIYLGIISNVYRQKVSQSTTNPISVLN